MMDSKPVFTARLKFFGLERLEKEFAKNGWTTMANYAFSVEFRPGTGPSQELLHKVIFKKLFPNIEEGDSNEEIIGVRRLYWECYSGAAVDMHRRMSPDTDIEKPRQLPKEERAARLQALRLKLGEGFEIAEETEPSDQLVDKYVTMQEKGVLKYLQWEHLTKWDTEARGEPAKDPYFALAGKHLEYNEAVQELTADTASDLKLANALTRRGVALEVAQLMSFKIHDGVVKWFLRAYNRPAIPGHAKVSLLQIKNTDEEIFVRLAALTRTGLHLAAQGAYPLDALMPEVLKDPRVTTLMTPLQLTNPAIKTLSNSPTRGGKASAPDKRFASEFAALKAENKRLRASSSGGGKGGGKGKGKDKGKGGGKGGKTPMPRELWGLESRTSTGAPICFGFNSAAGCANSPEHGGCKRGKHVCGKKGCGGAHSAVDCTK